MSSPSAVGTGTLTPAAPPPPTFAQIPLPPGMDLQQFQSLQASLVSLAITVAVVFGILVWDYFNLLPDEIKLYQTSNKDLWRTPATWAFVVLRYSGIMSTLPSLWFTALQSNHCQAAVVISQVGVVLVVASSGIIFCYRVFAIWGGNKVITAIIGFMYVIMLGCWIAVAAQYHASNGPPTPFGSNCQMHPIVPWAPISYSSSVAFDAVILILTVWKLNTNRATSSKVGYLIYRDSLMYFLLTAATNITVLVIQGLQGPKYDFVKPTAVPFSTLLTATMGVRVFLNLKLFNQRQARVNQGLPLSSTGSRGAGESFNRSHAATPMSAAMKLPVPPYPYQINLTSPEVGAKPQGPFAAYDYESPKTTRGFETAQFTRETVVVRE